MKLNINKEKCLGESQVINHRLSNVFGAGSYEKERKKIQEENRKKYVVAILMIGLLILATLFQGGMDSIFVKNNQGNIAAITKDKNNTEQIPITVSGKWNGEDFNKEVILDISDKSQKTTLEDNENQKGMEEEIKALELENMITEIVEQIGDKGNKSKIRLPSQLGDGTKITWHQEEKSYLLPILFLAMHQNQSRVKD